MGVDASDPAEAMPEALVLDDLGDLVLDEPGLVGVAQVVEVHPGLDGCPPMPFIAGEGGQPDPAAEVGAAVQPPVDPGEHEPAAAVLVALLAALLAVQLVEQIGVERRQVDGAGAGGRLGWAELQPAADLVERAVVGVDTDLAPVEIDPVPLQPGQLAPPPRTCT